jgi:hypothetical protein
LDASVDIRKHGAECRGHPVLCRDIKINGWKCTAAYLARRLVKRNDAAAAHRRCRPTDHGNGVGLMDQDVAADSGVEAGLSGRYTGARCA